MLPRQARVCVVGGGVIGTSVAYNLAKRGVKEIVLLEKNKLTSGTTWHAAGLVGQLRSTKIETTLSAEAIAQMLLSGRACAPQLLDADIDPDSAWRRNQPVPIKRGPLLFDFTWLPKPLMPPSIHTEADDALALALVGRKRKAEAPAEGGVV